MDRQVTMQSSQVGIRSLADDSIYSLPMVPTISTGHEIHSQPELS